MRTWKLKKMAHHGPEELFDEIRAALPSGCGVPPQAVPGASRADLPSPPAHAPSAPLPETGVEIDRIVDALRRSIRLAGIAYATEQGKQTPRRSAAPGA